ncbi:MAG: ABC transporter permease [Chloroflexi bacterium]|nr:ABC transporter permease [Chloroflexota bacterium]
MARNPAHHARLSLLLVLTAGLGVFAASFSATLERSSRDRLMYESGADVRVTGVRPPTEGISGTGLEQVRDMEGVGFATPVLRGAGWSESGGRGAHFDLLAVRPDEFAEVGWWRPDLARGGLGEVMDQIRVSPEEGLPLPEDAHWLTVRVRPFVARSDVWVVARLEDSVGRFYTLPLGSLHPMSVDRNRFPCAVPEDDEPGRPDWCRLGGSLMPPMVRGLSRLLPRTPVVLHSVGIVGLSGALNPGAVEIDDIAVVDRLGENLLVLETFDDPGRWQVLVNSANAQGDAFTGAVDVGGGEVPGVARFSWTQGSARDLRGFTMDDARAPLNAVASPSFMESVGASVGDEVPVSVSGDSFTVRVTGTARYFPTLDPSEGPFVLMDLQALADRLNLGRLAGDVQWNELWVRLADTGEGEAAGTAPGEAIISYEALAKTLAGSRVMFNRIVQRGPMLADAETDPLVTAGWRALLVVAFGTVLVVSAVGFFVHARVSFGARLGEFALLRTIGLSMRQLLALAVLEQVLVIGVAVGLGIFMGTRLGATIMPYLASSGGGVRVAPPMVTEVDWAGFCVTFGVVAAVFALVVAAILVYVYRMAIHRVMRLGER